MSWVHNRLTIPLLHIPEYRVVSEKILLGKGGNFLISTRRKGPLPPKTTYYLFTFLDGTVSLSKAQFLGSEKQELVTLSAKQQPLGWRMWAQSHQVWPTSQCFQGNGFLFQVQCLHFPFVATLRCQSGSGFLCLCSQWQENLVPLPLLCCRLNQIPSSIKV